MKAPTGTASILAIGTELTTGQITNRNAAWLSEKLDALGISTALHITVADDREIILQVLDHCAKMSQFIFVTGGLGPTTDDFTREVIAEWLGQPLKFDEPTWEKIVSRLTALAIPVALSNKQQCFFPVGATLIPNPQGTAAGFTCALKENQKRIWIFPGPPHEVEAVWKQGVEESLKKLIPNYRPVKLLTWQCIGKSEAELGEITEAALQGSNLLIGYRAHRPFVEIKVWCPEQDLKLKEAWIQKLDQALQPWLFTRQGEDVGALFLNRWALTKASAIQVIDAGSGGLLSARLSTLLRKREFTPLANIFTLITKSASGSNPETWVRDTLAAAEPHTATFVLGAITEDGRTSIGRSFGGEIEITPLQLPYRKAELMDRMRFYSVEVALKSWLN